MKQQRFAHKLVLVTGLASALVLLLVGGMAFYVGEQNIRDQLAEYQADSALTRMQGVDRTLFTAYQGIKVLAKDRRLIDLVGGDLGTLGNSRENEVSDYLEEISLLTGPWRVVSLLDTEGNLLVSNMPNETGDLIGAHPEYESAFQAAMEKRLYSSDLRMIGEEKNRSMIFAAPIHDGGLEGAQVVGVVMASYAWPVVVQLLDAVSPEVNVTLLRDDGTVIGTSSAQSDRVGSEYLNWESVQSGISGSRSRAVGDITDEDGTNSLIVAARQSGYLGYAGHGWTLVMEVPYKVLLAPMYTLAWRVGVTGLVGVLLLCLVLYITGMYLARPITRMSQTVRTFSRGDMTSRVEIAPGGNDEIAELGRAFNAMAEDIDFYVEQVKENSKEVQAFAYIVSHDLRAPLVNLKGFSTEIGYSMDELKALLGPAIATMNQQQQAEVLAILDEDIPEALQFIGSSVERMDGQIQAVLKLSRLGRKELTWEQVDSALVVKQVLSSLKHQLEDKQFVVKVRDLPSVEADAFALEQIFGNLLDNAVKYQADTPGQLEIWSTEALQEITFHIRDNGPGIDEANIHKVFELFRRVGRANIPGEGMGLAYVKTLVRRHGGRIWCESVLGKGSTFSFSLAQKPSAQPRELA
ncbi:sensor histidine kinase [Halopseudomonas laoshanensis]|uniref:histidine kinase n=1 Tax=Halopseudomonas laoshanensis TaxID=2268758 RepID=A0A7V7GWK1_9GAMM|nr:ATP-binding protein [Halopseudomonas laoshanensis]KAA0695061.1 sensor histidine kinase [Halopseudomonas laoshanensis]